MILLARRALQIGLLGLVGIGTAGAAWGTAIASAASGWQLAAPMEDVRREHSAVLLRDGRVLVVSGVNSRGELAHTEVYDPATGGWSRAASVLEPRRYATATLLRDGRVLVAGGSNTAATEALSHAELYDPVANTWTATSPMAEPRNGAMAVRLADGRVLVAGGADGEGEASGTAEIYDPVSGTWSSAGSFGDGARQHQMTTLADGRVLVVGGYDTKPSTVVRTSGAVYDPANNVWTSISPMSVARAQMNGGLLPDGTVLVPGGVNVRGLVEEAVRYDPATGTWESAGRPGIAGDTSFGIVLEDGRYLHTAGKSTSTPIYDGSVEPASAGWTSTYSTSALREWATLTRLTDGRVLLAGGSDLASAEIFTPPTERSAEGGTFGDVEIADRAERDVTVRNAGGNNLWIDAVSIAGADASAFTVVTDHCSGTTVAAGADCVVRVRFKPSAVRAHAAELRFDDNAETSPAAPLTGDGIPERHVPPLPVPDPPLPVPDPPLFVPNPPQPVPAGCTRPYVALVGITAAGTASKPTAKLSGLANPSMAGQRVTVFRGTRSVASSRIAADGRISVTVPAPKALRARSTARYRLQVSSSVRSGAMKATRRVAASRSSRLADGRTQITGSVAGVRKPTTLTVKSTPICGGGVTNTRVKTDGRGRYRVTVPGPPTGVPATVHRVWFATRSVTLPVVVTAPR